MERFNGMKNQMRPIYMRKNNETIHVNINFIFMSLTNDRENKSMLLLLCSAYLSTLPTDFKDYSLVASNQKPIFIQLYWLLSNSSSLAEMWQSTLPK